MDDLQTFEAARRRLFALAYRMLGDAVEAEDVVQDAYLRWAGRSGEPVRVPDAWLTKAVTNLCLNRLTSARTRRESYVGEWLPSPVPTPSGHELEPADTVEQRETVTVAVLRLCEQLTPPERAVFVLREAFGYPFREIGALLDVEEAHARQLALRARRRVGLDRRAGFAVDPDRHARLVAHFLHAAAGGDPAKLHELLADDVVAYADGGGKMTAARRPVHGRDRVARYFTGLVRHPQAVGIEAAVRSMNHRPMLVFIRGGTLFGVIDLQTEADAVTAVHTMVNPDKLAYASARFG